jgi:hypothetical protein
VGNRKDGRALTTFRANTIRVTPNSICTNMVVPLCFSAEKLNDNEFIGYAKSRPSDYCTFRRTRPPSF